MKLFYNEKCLKYIIRIKTHYKEFIIHLAKCGHIRKHLKHQISPLTVNGVKLFPNDIEGDCWEKNYGYWGDNYFYSTELSGDVISWLFSTGFDTHSYYRGFFIRHCLSCVDFSDEISFPSFQHLIYESNYNFS